MTDHLEHVRTSIGRIVELGGVADTLLLTRRDAAALAEAEALDAADDSRPLAGRVVAVKALFDVEGWVTHAGSAVLAEDPPAKSDAALVTALCDAGAIVLAQSNMTEFAYGALGLNPTYGTPTSPFYPDGERVSGGSTSGGAVAVAQRLVDIALGSDTSGSIRIPAAFCGVAGFKPSKGRYSEAGMASLSPTFDVPGIIAASAAVCRDVDLAITDHDRTAASDVDLGGLVFAVPRGLIEPDLDPVIAAAFGAWIDALLVAGVRIVDRDLPSWPDATAAARDGSIISVEAHAIHRARLAVASDRYDRRVGPRIANGEHIAAHIYAAALMRLRYCAARCDTEMDGIDAVLTPTVPILPPRLADLVDDDAYLATNMLSFRLTEYANRLDLPSISIPGDLRARRPYGLMLTGLRGDDDRLLDIAVAVEQRLTGWEPTGSFRR